MPNGIPLTDELWSDLYNGTPNMPKYNLSPAEWQWLHQVGKIQSSSIDLSNPLAPVVNYHLPNETYEISLRFVKNFPQQVPIVDCDYQQCFAFDWDPSSESCTLSSIVSQYEQFINKFDEALGIIIAIDEDGYFVLEQYVTDNDDPDLLAIKFNLKEGNEQFAAKINWKRPLEFPQELRSSNPNRFDGIDCDQWESDFGLSYNFARLCDLETNFPFC